MRPIINNFENKTLEDLGIVMEMNDIHLSHKGILSADAYVAKAFLSNKQVASNHVLFHFFRKLLDKLIKSFYVQPFSLSDISTQRWLKKDSDTALVFIHGFRGEKNTKNTWHSHINQLGERYYCSVYGIIWPSLHEQFANIQNIANLMSIPSEITINFLRAKDKSDYMASNLNEILSLIPEKNIILIGHSLGARVLLNATCLYQQDMNRIKGVVALSPALSDQNLRKINQITPLVTYSSNDLILNYLYPLATNEQAIGFIGSNKDFLNMINLSYLDFGHNEYTSTKFKELIDHQSFLNYFNHLLKK